jgi:hypothetical protein
MTETMTMTMPAYARRHGVSRVCTGKWAKRGIVVMTADGLVDVHKSDKRLAGRPERYRGGKAKDRERAMCVPGNLADAIAMQPREVWFDPSPGGAAASVAAMRRTTAASSSRLKRAPGQRSIRQDYLPSLVSSAARLASSSAAPSLSSVSISLISKSRRAVKVSTEPKSAGLAAAIERKDRAARARAGGQVGPLRRSRIPRPIGRGRVRSGACRVSTRGYGRGAARQARGATVKGDQ